MISLQVEYDTHKVVDLLFLYFLLVAARYALESEDDLVEWKTESYREEENKNHLTVHFETQVKSTSNPVPVNIQAWLMRSISSSHISTQPDTLPLIVDLMRQAEKDFLREGLIKILPAILDTLREVAFLYGSGEGNLRKIPAKIRDILGEKTNTILKEWFKGLEKGKDKKSKASQEQKDFMRQNHKFFKDKWIWLKKEYKKNPDTWKDEALKKYQDTDRDLLSRLEGDVPNEIRVNDPYAYTPGHIAAEELARKAGCKNLTYQDVMRYI